MTRRKGLVVREPNGRAQRRPPQLPPASEVARLRDAAFTGMRDPVWGSTLGWLYLSGKINAVQFQSGKRWSELCQDYSTACLAPRAPRSPLRQETSRGAADPDSAQGLKEGRRAVLIVKGYIAALALLRSIGEAPRHAVMDVCELNRMPSGYTDLNELRTGLQALAVLWAAPK